MEYTINTSIFGKSDMGRVRTNNEDAFVAQTIWDDNTYLGIAIDGVGGYEGGEIAAEIARKTIPEYLSASSNGERVELLKQAVTAANNAIFEAREADPEHGQMGCVLTAAIIDVAQRQISMAHVGDSRLYCFRNGTLKKLSHDHSLIGYREEIGDLTEEEAMHHPQRNVIGRDVGSQKHKPNDDDFIEAKVFPLLPNTTLLFCSDGLTDMITSSIITEILGRKASLEEKTDALIQAALAAGGKDNVTVVLFEFQSDEPEPVPTTSELSEEGAKTIEETVVETVPATAKKSNGLKFVLCGIVGLLIGAGIVYYEMNKKLVETNGKLELMTQEKEDLQERFDALEKNYDSLLLSLDTISTVDQDLELEDE